MSPKNLVTTALLSVSVLALAACGGGAPSGDDTLVLHRGNNAEPLSLDPHKSSGTWEKQYHR